MFGIVRIVLLRSTCIKEMGQRLRISKILLKRAENIPLGINHTQVADSEWRTCPETAQSIAQILPVVRVIHLLFSCFALQPRVTAASKYYWVFFFLFFLSSLYVHCIYLFIENACFISLSA